MNRRESERKPIGIGSYTTARISSKKSEDIVSNVDSNFYLNGCFPSSSASVTSKAFSNIVLQLSITRAAIQEFLSSADSA